MGLMMAVCIAAGILTAGGGGYLVCRERQKSVEKTERIIREVDDVKPVRVPKKPEDEIKEILDRVNRDEIHGRWIFMPEKKKETENGCEEFKESIQMARDAGVPEEEILKTDEEIDDFFMHREINVEIDDPDDQPVREEAKTEDPPVAEEPKPDYNTWTIWRMEYEFDRMFNPYPITVSPASLFGEAHSKGLISDETYKKAQEYYGKRWFYAGD